MLGSSSAPVGIAARNEFADLGSIRYTSARGGGDGASNHEDDDDDEDDDEDEDGELTALIERFEAEEESDLKNRTKAPLRSANGAAPAKKAAPAGDSAQKSPAAQPASSAAAIASSSLPEWATLGNAGKVLLAVALAVGAALLWRTLKQKRREAAESASKKQQEAAVAQAVAARAAAAAEAKAEEAQSEAQEAKREAKRSRAQSEQTPQASPLQEWQWPHAGNFSSVPPNPYWTPSYPAFPGPNSGASAVPPGFPGQSPFGGFVHPAPGASYANSVPPAAPAATGPVNPDFANRPQGDCPEFLGALDLNKLEDWEKMKHQVMHYYDEVRSTNSKLMELQGDKVNDIIVIERLQEELKLAQAEAEKLQRTSARPARAVETETTIPRGRDTLSVEFESSEPARRSQEEESADEGEEEEDLEVPPIRSQQKQEKEHKESAANAGVATPVRSEAKREASGQSGDPPFVTMPAPASAAVPSPGVSAATPKVARDKSRSPKKKRSPGLPPRVARNGRPAPRTPSLRPEWEQLRNEEDADDAEVRRAQQAQ